jgi:hypothetical protein
MMDGFWVGEDAGRDCVQAEKEKGEAAGERVCGQTERLSVSKVDDQRASVGEWTVWLALPASGVRVKTYRVRIPTSMYE